MVWLFVGLEWIIKKAFIVPLLSESNESNRRDAATLIALIIRYIRQSSIIYTDCLCVYNNLNNMGYAHYQVNYSQPFVDPVNRSAHTQNNERLRGMLKKSRIRSGNSSTSCCSFSKGLSHYHLSDFISFLWKLHHYIHVHGDTKDYIQILF